MVKNESLPFKNLKNKMTHNSFVRSQPGNGIWVIYDHFQGSLRHDPDYGLMLCKFIIIIKRWTIRSDSNDNWELRQLISNLFGYSVLLHFCIWDRCCSLLFYCCCHCCFYHVHNSQKKLLNSTLTAINHWNDRASQSNFLEEAGMMSALSFTCSNSMFCWKIKHFSMLKRFTLLLKSTIAKISNAIVYWILLNDIAVRKRKQFRSMDIHLKNKNTEKSHKEEWPNTTKKWFHLEFWRHSISNKSD